MANKGKQVHSAFVHSKYLFSISELISAMLLLSVLLLVISGVPVRSGNPSNLRQVHLIFRHGARTPCDLSPTDPYKGPSYWPVGIGQLTSEGKRMHFELRPVAEEEI